MLLETYKERRGSRNDKPMINTILSLSSRSTSEIAVFIGNEMAFLLSQIFLKAKALSNEPIKMSLLIECVRMANEKHYFFIVRSYMYTCSSTCTSE